MIGGVWMAGNAYYVPTAVYRFLPLIYIAAGVVALLSAANLVGIVSSLLLIGAGVLAFVWRCRAASRRRRGRSKPKPQSRAGSLPPDFDYPAAKQPAPRAAGIPGGSPNASRESTSPPKEFARHSTSPSHQSGRAAMFGNPRLKRRSGIQDRRGWEPMPDAPFRDSEGALVKRDRRRLPERRKNSIEVREVSEKERSDPL